MKIRIAFVATAIVAGLSFYGSAASADAAHFTSTGSATQAEAATTSTSSASELACSRVGCGDVTCPPGYTCVYSPKQCFTTPCPQYDCVPINGGTPSGWPYPPNYVVNPYPYPYQYPYPYTYPYPRPRPYPYPHPYPHPRPGPHPGPHPGPRPLHQEPVQAGLGGPAPVIAGQIPGLGAQAPSPNLGTGPLTNGPLGR